MAVGYCIEKLFTGMEGTYWAHWSSDVYLNEEKCKAEVARLNAEYVQNELNLYNDNLERWQKENAKQEAEHNALVAAGLRKGKCKELRILKTYYKVHKPFEPPSAIYALAECNIIE